MTVQGPVTFHDVAASFTDEQWLRLDNWQKDIYKNVMKEIHEALIALGYTILNPNITFNIKRRDEAFVRVDNRSVENKSVVAGDLPDIIVKIKDEPLGDAPVFEEKHDQQNVAQPSTSGPVISSVSSLNIKEEKGIHRRTSSPPAKKSNVFPIKSEEDVYSIDDYNIAGGEETPSLGKGASGLIKQESDSLDDETDTEDLQSTIPIVVKQEDSDPVSDDHIEEIESSGRYSTNFTTRKAGGKHKRTVTRALTTGPKKRRAGSQVPGDILSVEEREARRLRVLEGMVKPFREQPCFMFDPIKSPDLKEESASEQEDQRDIGSTDWCKCGRCCLMSTVEESVCCHEIPSLSSQLNEECTCITQHPAFEELCLDHDRLDFLYRFLARSKRKNDVLYYIHKLRRTSYRAFVIWTHGFLDFRNYKPIPACVVKSVQDFLPYPEELNVGFLKMCDYPAAIMALDHI